MTIQFVESDAQKIYNDLILQFEQALGVTLYQGDERRIFLEQQALVLVALRNALNDTGNQNLLRYARGEVLDALGERTDTPRLPAQKAITTVRFTLSAAQPGPLTIPAGTRVTPDGKLFFAVKQDLVIASGATTGDAQAEATVAGAAHNGFVAGQINKIVDPVAYVASVVNIDTSSGGADIEPDDDGENVWSGYRERIRESVTKFSTAGPIDSYIYWAKSADSNIQDVVVTSPSAGEVKITVLMKDGASTTQTILDKVSAVCNDKKVRPLTDHVTVAGPINVGYTITLTYYISQANATEENNIRNAIEGAGGAVDQFKTWLRDKLGRAINPDYLRQLMLNAGAYRIVFTAPVYCDDPEVSTPTYATIAADSVASLGTINITYGGLE